MHESKRLSKRQLAVAEDLFAGELDEQKVLDKYKVSRKLYNRWLAEPAFAERLRQCIDATHLRSAVLVARNAPKAADTLLELTASDKGETARKACLDIILMNTPAHSADTLATPDAMSENHPPLSNATASKILAALAEEKDHGQEFGS
jgi:hypothetical protein